MYTVLNFLNLKIIYSKSRESVDLNLELIRLETFAYFWPLTNEISPTNLETVKEILIPCFQTIWGKKRQKSSCVFAKCFHNHDNSIHRVVFTSVTLLAEQ